MNSRFNSTSKLVLILAFACAIFVSGAQTHAAASYNGGRLIVQRAPNFGTDLAVQLSIDGRKVANIPRDQHYEGSVSSGRHALTVVALPNIESRQPTSMRLTVQSGHTYIFTAVWQPDRGVVLRRSTLASDTTQVPPVKAPTR